MAATFGAPLETEASGVIAEQGDWNAGWAWFLANGTLTWVLALNGSTYRLGTPIPAGARAVVLDMTAQDQAFDLVLQTDTGQTSHAEVAVGFPRLQPRRFIPHGRLRTTLPGLRRLRTARTCPGNIAAPHDRYRPPAGSRLRHPAQRRYEAPMSDVAPIDRSSTSDQVAPRYAVSSGQANSPPVNDSIKTSSPPDSASAASRSRGTHRPRLCRGDLDGTAPRSVRGAGDRRGRRRHLRALRAR